MIAGLSLMEEPGARSEPKITLHSEVYNLSARGITDKQTPDPSELIPMPGQIVYDKKVG
jgi:hypothetical protein